MEFKAGTLPVEFDIQNMKSKSRKLPWKHLTRRYKNTL